MASPNPESARQQGGAPQSLKQRKSAVQAHERRVLLRNFLIEAVLYGILVVLYFMIALRWLAAPLNELFHDRRITYAVLSLILILAQGVALEYVTAFLLEQLRLEERE
jgi:hypothetical protein